MAIFFFLRGSCVVLHFFGGYDDFLVAQLYSADTLYGSIIFSWRSVLRYEDFVLA